MIATNIATFPRCLKMGYTPDFFWGLSISMKWSALLSHIQISGFCTNSSSAKSNIYIYILCVYIYNIHIFTHPTIFQLFTYYIPTIFPRYPTIDLHPNNLPSNVTGRPLSPSAVLTSDSNCKAPKRLKRFVRVAFLSAALEMPGFLMGERSDHGMFIMDNGTDNGL